MQSVFRPIEADEQSDALDLWHTVFDVSRDYFARYYAADPWYQPGDSVGAWVGGRLVSAVHLCRRPLAWNGAALLCGGIANVATLPEYRKNGLSRRLLSLAIERMESGGFAFSLLGTGVPDHYARLGWEMIQLPRFQIALSGGIAPANSGLETVRPTETLKTLYERTPRPLQQERPPLYFEKWVGWHWASNEALRADVPGEGYLVLKAPASPEQPITVEEWCAGNTAAEEALFRQAVRQAQRLGKDRIVFDAMPQHIALSSLETLGTLKKTQSWGQMIRNVSLSESDYTRVKKAYLSGRAAWWPADGF